MRTADLTGALLALWAARHDPRCVDITWKQVNDDWIGYGTIGSSPEFPCLIVTDAPVIKRLKLAREHGAEIYAPHEDWAQGGPIIESERILVAPEYEGGWNAAVYGDSEESLCVEFGPTLLIAAMRAYVGSKFGGTVPDEVTA
jgi:hypothetical protein